MARCVGLSFPSFLRIAPPLRVHDPIERWADFAADPGAIDLAAVAASATLQFRWRSSCSWSPSQLVVLLVVHPTGRALRDLYAARAEWGDTDGFVFQRDGRRVAHGQLADDFAAAVNGAGIDDHGKR